VAILFWIPIFSPDPSPWRMGHPARLIYLLTQMPSMSFLGVTILNASTVLYPAYLGRSIAFGLDPLADQQLSGAIMWGVGDGVFILAMGLVIWDWMKREAVETVRVDARLARDDSERAVIDARADALAAAKAAGSMNAAGSAAAVDASQALSAGTAAGGSTP
jgi:cytochrome c oxidase assembly factor CtaG